MAFFEAQKFTRRQSWEAPKALGLVPGVRASSWRAILMYSVPTEARIYQRLSKMAGIIGSAILLRKMAIWTVFCSNLEQLDVLVGIPNGTVRAWIGTRSVWALLADNLSAFSAHQRPNISTYEQNGRHALSCHFALQNGRFCVFLWFSIQSYQPAKVSNRVLYSVILLYLVSGLLQESSGTFR